MYFSIKILITAFSYVDGFFLKEASKQNRAPCVICLLTVKSPDQLNSLTEIVQSRATQLMETK